MGSSWAQYSPTIYMKSVRRHPNILCFQLAELIEALHGLILLREVKLAEGRVAVHTDQKNRELGVTSMLVQRNPA